MERFLCILEDNKECSNCLECQMCDLNDNIECTNCGKCIQPTEDYKIIKIDRIDNN